jgi:hypothetical protein
MQRAREFNRNDPGPQAICRWHKCGRVSLSSEPCSDARHGCYRRCDEPQPREWASRDNGTQAARLQCQRQHRGAVVRQATAGAGATAA